jgi:hypothetical protein
VQERLDWRSQKAYNGRPCLGSNPIIRPCLPL